MDTLSGLPEAVEAVFADAVAARDDALAALASGPGGLGPPDLCWLQKGRGHWEPGSDPAAAGCGGYHHSVLGGDVSSSAAIAGYFGGLLARVERPGYLQSFFQGSELALQRGFYCCYDAISGTDIRCELCVPGGVVSGVVDAAGALRDAADPLLWQQAQVCGVAGRRPAQPLCGEVGFAQTTVCR